MRRPNGPPAVCRRRRSGRPTRSFRMTIRFLPFAAVLAAALVSGCSEGDPYPAAAAARGVGDHGAAADHSLRRRASSRRRKARARWTSSRASPASSTRSPTRKATW
ncbi:MAG: hypothetical protein MZW92_51900 [Comamonadaceae bacterium]|nr:hypothetical protein [Comamonadaceae bacterium]